MRFSRRPASFVSGVALAASVAMAVSAHADTFDCATPFGNNCNGIIPDQNTLSSTFLVEPNAQTTCDLQTPIVAVGVKVALEHRWMGDLTMTLTHPDGTRVTLIARPGLDTNDAWGCGSEDLDATFSDTATTSANQCNLVPPAIGGDVYSLSPLSVLNGKPRYGTWTLSVSDGAAFGWGALEGWSLIMPCSLPAISAVATQPAATASTPGVVTFTRDGATTGDLAVRYSVLGTAAPSLYQPLTGTVTIPDGSASATVNVTPTTIPPNSQSTVVLTVLPTIATSVGTPPSATVNIVGATCGDGVVDPGETCDDGAKNGTPGDACEKNCTTVSCGNGIIDINEQCDDGPNNGKSGATCSKDCFLNIRQHGCGCTIGEHSDGNNNAGLALFFAFALAYVAVRIRRARATKEHLHA